MNNITWEYLLDILKYTQNYEDCLQLLITCKTFYNNQLLNQLIKQFYTYIIIDKYGTKKYYFNRKLHNTDGPAIECLDGHKSWYQNDKLHNENGYAIEYIDGTKKWFQNNKLHRIDGPAIEWEYGSKYWYQNDKLHRLDGPAIEYSNGTKKYCLYGVRYNKKEYYKQIKKLIK